MPARHLPRAPRPRALVSARVAAGALVGALACALAPARRVAAQAPAPPAVAGRWDVTATRPDGSRYPAWLEVTLSGRRTLVGRFMHGVGSARPVARVDLAGDTVRFALPPQWDEAPGELRVEGVLAGGRLAGTLVTESGERHAWVGVRAPALARAEPPRWGAPVALFNGRDLAGWEAAGPGENRWRVAGGVLAAAGGGANLRTRRAFDDFRLRAEFRYPPGANSGVYLRGRYEVQIEDGPRRDQAPLAVDMGGVYGLLPPNEHAARAPRAWQTYELTLVGRRVTVVLNGRTVVCDQVIPGPTGGALDSDEGAPGPVLLQGDHGPVEFRRLELTPALPPRARAAAR